MDSSFHVIKSVPLTLTFLDTTHRFIKAERFKLKYSLKTSCPEGTPNKDVELYQNTSYRIINEFLDKPRRWKLFQANNQPSNLFRYNNS